MAKPLKRQKRRRPRREVIKRLRERAPRHPAGAEASLKHAVARLFLLLSQDIRRRVKHVAPRLLRRHRRDSVEPELAHELDQSRRLGQRLVNGPGFHSAVWQAAHQTAAQTASQVKKATGTHKTADLSKPTTDLANAVITRAGELVEDAVDRADAVVGEWLDLDPELSERAEDIDALDAMIAEDQDRNTGKALAAAALAFGAAFAVMNRDAQQDAGAGRYMWLSLKDSRVRPAHRALDEEIAAWDDPPLKSSESDNEEDDHAGEDYGCRCVASPLTPDDEEELELE